MSYLSENCPVNTHDLNKRETAVWIGGDGKKGGEIINVRGVWVHLPKKPFDRKIANFNRKQSTQYWERIDWSYIDDIGDEKEREAEREKFLEEEFDRIDNGYWLYIDGEATWLTGQHYYYLNYIRLDIGYPEFRYRDLYFLYFWEAAKEHEACYGVTMTKPRRMGASWIAVGILLRDVTSMKEVLGGILSKTGEDAKNFFIRKLVRAFRDLPSFLRPYNSSGTNPRTSLDFTEISRRDRKAASSRGVTAHGEVEEVLNSYIEWRANGENAFDSEKVYRLVYDEVGKIEERVNLPDQIDTILRCMYDNGKVIGKAFMPSTVNRMEKGGGQYKDVYYASRFDDAENERTSTGLWAYFVPAYDGLGGYVNIFGKSIIHLKKGQTEVTRDGVPILIGAKDKLETDRKVKARQGLTALIEECRKMPFTEQEAFYFVDEKAVLDIGRIQMQLNHNDGVIGKTWVRGNFIWESEFGGDVRWVPNPNGRFRVSHIPPKEHQNKRLFKKGRPYPANAHIFRGGCDPYDIDQVLYGTGSKGGFHIKTTKHLESWAPSLKTILEYIERPPLAPMFFEDVLKANIFYGCMTLTENQRKNIINYFEQNGFDHYQMDRPENTYGKKASDRIKQDKGCPMSSVDIQLQHLNYLHLGVMEEIGEMEDGSMGDFDFDTTLGQLNKYNIENRTDLDGVVSWGFANMAAHIDIHPIKKRTTTGPIVKKYKTSRYRYR